MSDLYYRKYKKYKYLYNSLAGSNMKQLNEVLSESQEKKILSKKLVHRIEKLFGFLNRHFSSSKLNKVYTKVIDVLNYKIRKKQQGGLHIGKPSLIDTSLNNNNYSHKQKRKLQISYLEIQLFFQILYIVGKILSIPIKILLEVSKN